MTIFRIGCITVILIPVLTIAGTNGPSPLKDTGGQASHGHRTGLTARVISTDGLSRTVTLEGVGCSESMCSRVFIQSTSDSGARVQTWLDSIESIKDTTERDALFVMKDGTEQRLAFVTDFRVLYVSSPTGKRQKLDLAKIRSLEFVDPRK
jgi:hypothetical protein